MKKQKSFKEEFYKDIKTAETANKNDLKDLRDTAPSLRAMTGKDPAWVETQTYRDMMEVLGEELENYWGPGSHVEFSQALRKLICTHDDGRRVEL